MNKRVLRVVGLLAALLLIFVIGAAAGGGAVFAATKALGTDGVELIIPPQADLEKGLVIASVALDGPAAEAGLQRGDILLKLNGEEINQPLDLFRTIGDLEAGDEVELTVLHGDEERVLTAILDERDGRPYLGVVPCGGPGEPGVMTIRMAHPGARIIEVLPDSPADQAGLEGGDVITAVDGEEVDPAKSLADLIAQYEPGDRVTLEVIRPGEEESREVTVELGEHPEEEGKAYLGVQYAPAPRIERFEGRPMPFFRPHREVRPFEGDQLFIFPGDKVEQGAVVRGVTDDSPAQAAGLQRGDIITQVEGEEVDDPKALVEAVEERQPGDELSLTVYRPEGDETLEVEVTLGQHPNEEGKAYLGVMVTGLLRIERLEDYELPELQDLERRFEFRAPFDLEIEPYWFEFPAPPGECCDGFSQTA